MTRAEFWEQGLGVAVAIACGAAALLWGWPADAAELVPSQAPDAEMMVTAATCGFFFVTLPLLAFVALVKRAREARVRREPACLMPYQPPRLHFHLQAHLFDVREVA